MLFSFEVFFLVDLLCRCTPIQEEECYQQHDYCHGHDAPHEGHVGFADVASHKNKIDL